MVMKAWSEIVNDPAFSSLSDSKKQEVVSDYRRAGGSIPEVYGNSGYMIPWNEIENSESYQKLGAGQKAQTMQEYANAGGYLSAWNRNSGLIEETKAIIEPVLMNTANWFHKDDGKFYSQEEIDTTDLQDPTARVARDITVALLPVPGARVAEGASLGVRAGTTALNLAKDSAVFQIETNGEIDPQQTVEDMAIGGALHGAIKGTGKLFNGREMMSKMVGAGYKDMDAVERIDADTEAAQDYVHSVSQLNTLARITEGNQAISPDTDVGDALLTWAKAAPEMHYRPSYEPKEGMKRGIQHTYRPLTPLQQVVATIPGTEINPHTTVDEMAEQIRGMSLDELKSLANRREKMATTELNKATANAAKKYRYNGKLIDALETQEILAEQRGYNPLNYIFSSDINELGANTLDEFGVPKTVRGISKVAGWAEAANPFNRAARRYQFNHLANNYSKEVKGQLSESLAYAEEKQNEASQAYDAYQRQNTLQNVANVAVLDARVGAMTHSVENLKGLMEQIGEASKGKQTNAYSKFSDAMYNAQTRKFVPAGEEEMRVANKDLKDAARKINLMSKQAAPTWEGVLNGAGGGVLAAELVGQRMLDIGIVPTAVKGSVAGQTVKRLIDGWVNGKMAQASKMLNQSTLIDANTGEIIQRNMKEQLDDHMNNWWGRYVEDNGHNPSTEEAHAEIDKEAVRLVRELYSHGIHPAALNMLIRAVMYSEDEAEAS
ncbi:hypothetical protein PZS63_00645 [Klebsiella aerogenes]|uniref:hypothetical protein n=1 Tax=Klebsiella aerogenes TaxID=548 RepID=UPI002B26E069|nr:hypothetical protein [Klebsiella aerogenes]MEA8782136.1 hypothetical protein [Klebsiella aerogenes]